MSERENGSFASEADSLFSSPARSDEDRFPIPAHPAGEEWDFAQRSRNLCDVIVAMSRRQAFSDKDLKGLAKFFSEVYDANDFRHKYSDITAALLGEYRSYEDGSEGGQSPDFVLLVSNIDEVARVLSQSEGASKRTLASLGKLSDHVALEAQRMLYLSQQNASYAEQVERLNISLIKERAKLKKLKKSMEEMQREYITILGIFAAVVLVANAGIAFTTSAINESIAYGVAGVGFVVILVGAVLFNVFFSLFTFIYRMVRRGDASWGVISKGTFLNVNVALLAFAAIMFVIAIAGGGASTFTPA